MAAVAMEQVARGVGDIVQRAAGENKRRGVRQSAAACCGGSSAQNDNMKAKNDAEELSSNMVCGGREACNETTANVGPPGLK